MLETFCQWSNWDWNRWLEREDFKMWSEEEMKFTHILWSNKNSVRERYKIMWIKFKTQIQETMARSKPGRIKNPLHHRVTLSLFLIARGRSNNLFLIQSNFQPFISILEFSSIFWKVTNELDSCEGAKLLLCPEEIWGRGLGG